MAFAVEAACRAAVNLDLAAPFCKPERPKGSASSARAVAKRVRDASDDSIASDCHGVVEPPADAHAASSTKKRATPCC